MPTEIAGFAGPWQLSKEITDKRGPDARFSGEARITQALGGFIYTEAGTLRFGTGASVQAERKYLWSPSDGGIAVAFDDGRPFHHLPFQGGLAEHFCDPDHYWVSYNFGGWPLHWTTHWTVSGPRKDYQMTCQFRR